MVSSKKQHKQNEYGLSYNAMIVLAIQNSPAAINSEFCNRGASIQDIYKFLKAHVRPIAEMNQKEWNKTERVIRHSLSQTTYFNRFSIGEDGTSTIYASRAKGAEKGSLWTLYPSQGETEERCRLRIKKVFKDENVLNFREYLFNPDILEAIKNGTYGWHGPNGESLGVSDAIRKLQDRGYSPQNPAFVATTAPSVSQTSTSTTRSSRKRRAESDSEDDESDEDELTDENVSPREYNLRPRKKIEKREPEGVRYVEIPPEGLDLDKIQRDEIEAQYAPIAPQTGYDLPYYNGYPPHPSTQDYQHLSALGFQQFGMPPASTGMYYPTNYPQYPHPSEPYFSQQNYPSFQSPIPLDPNGILPTEDELDLEPDYQNSYPDYEDADSHSQLFEL